MKLQPKRKFIFLAIAACIAFSVILNGAIIADNLDHYCQTCKVPDCPTCQKIERAEIFLNALKLTSIILFFIIFFGSIIQTPNAHKEHDACLLSPVMLKVRFNT